MQLRGAALTDEMLEAGTLSARGFALPALEQTVSVRERVRAVQQTARFIRCCGQTARDA